MSAQWLPLQKYWRLNERCYGDLEGKKREDVAKEVDDDQVKSGEEALMFRRLP